MAVNSTLSSTIIAREALRLLKNNLVMGSNVYRAYEGEFPGAPKKGGSVTIRKPVKFVVTKARTRTSSVITEYSTTITVSTQAHVSWTFETAQLALTIEEYSARYIRPAAAVLANQVDLDLCSLYSDVWNRVWQTSFANPSAFLVIAKAMQKLDEEAAPQDERVVVLSPAANWSLANALTSLYLNEPGTAALRKGYLGRIGNAEMYMDQNVKTHTMGEQHDTGSTNSDVVMFNLTAGTGCPTGGAINTSNKTAIMADFRVTANKSTLLRVGDTFEVASVYAVNPMSGESTGSLRSFVVTAEASARTGTETTSGGQVTVSFEPAMVNTGPYKTVNTLPGAGGTVQATVYFYHNPNKIYPQNLAFHKNAFALCMVPLEVPESTWGSTATEDGISVRVIKDYQVDSDLEVCRMDILYGVKTIYPELAVRIDGKEQT